MDSSKNFLVNIPEASSQRQREPGQLLRVLISGRCECSCQFRIGAAILTSISPPYTIWTPKLIAPRWVDKKHSCCTVLCTLLHVSNKLHTDIHLRMSSICSSTHTSHHTHYAAWKVSTQRLAEPLPCDTTPHTCSSATDGGHSHDTIPMLYLDRLWQHKLCANRSRRNCSSPSRWSYIHQSLWLLATSDRRQSHPKHLPEKPICIKCTHGTFGILTRQLQFQNTTTKQIVRLFI